jgi:putative NADPH-quinone reductase
MPISLILAHPDPQSFNHAIAATAARAARECGHQVQFHDLYAEGFDPLLPGTEPPREASLPPVVAQHCAEVAQADGIIITHPNWWGQPPAILKGWVDRVLRPGVAYGFEEGDQGEGVPVGLLKARCALVLNTSNTPWEREREVFGDPLEAIWRRCIFGLCGVTDVRRRMFGVIVTSTPDERRQWLDEVAQMVAEAFPTAET